MLAMALAPLPASAAPVLIDFEGLADGDPVGASFAGATFSNAVALIEGISGGSLNELDFPTVSPITVAFDDSGPMRIDFATAVTSFSGLFTYNMALLVQAFSASDVLLDSTTSAFSENFGTSMTSPFPNELLSVVSPGIAYVIITGNPSGASFALDNAMFDTATVAVPEPATLALYAVGLAVVARRRRAIGLGRSTAP
jgi:hypothetical protein